MDDCQYPLLRVPRQGAGEDLLLPWWTFRKHLKKTDEGFILSEFLHPVSHSTEHNAISCAAGHHTAEGRWLRNPTYLNDYIRFWLTSGPGGGLQESFHDYSGWMAHAVWQRYLVNGDRAFAVGLLQSLIRDFERWEEERRSRDRLFWQYDVRDGMEESVSGSRTEKNRRPTINSYMFGNAEAISKLAELAGEAEIAERFASQAELLQLLIQAKLWDPGARFFKARRESGALAGVRELIGYTPWYFSLPDPGYEIAWEQLLDPDGFHAPYGPTTAEQRHPGFTIAYEGDDCQWNGPSWPFSTSVTLTAMANLLNNYDQKVISKADYFDQLLTYSRSQRLEEEGGSLIPWIDENLHPFTGQWLARAIKIQEGSFNHRGDHYNHSTFCDLVISGLVGIRPESAQSLSVNPLVPSEVWDYFALDRILYRGQEVGIFWDRTGEKYGLGRGLRLFVDGREVAFSEELGLLKARLP